MEGYVPQVHPYCFGLSFSHNSQVCTMRCIHGVEGSQQCPQLFYEKYKKQLSEPTHIQKLLQLAAYKLQSKPLQPPDGLI
jgi:hypothetical protein